MPMTSPCMLNIGPPEFPWLTAASVWKYSARDMPLNVAFGLRRPLMYPTVSVWLTPRGAPTTNTCSPTSTASESPSFTTNGPRGGRSSCRSATSAAGSDDATRALSVSPVKNTTSIASAVCTTWAAVSTLPSGEISTPDPSPATLTCPAIPPRATSVSRVWISTTAGFTRLNTSDSTWSAAGVRPAPARATETSTSRRNFILKTSSGKRSRDAGGRRDWRRGWDSNPR